MGLQDTPSAERVQIGFFGCRNAGIVFRQKKHGCAGFGRLPCKLFYSGKVCLLVRTGAELRERGGHSRQPLHTSTQAL